MGAFTKRTLGGVALLGSAALVLSGCAAPAGETTPGPDQPAAESLTLKVGTALPITGSLAFLGPPEIAGTEYAAAEINAANAGITFVMLVV